MNSDAFKARPFDSSVGLNIVLHVVLSALNILISKFYLLELVKRHPLKFENDNQLKAGLVQSLLSLIPSLVFSIFSGTKHHSGYLKSSYSSILLACSLVTAIVAWKSKRVILVDLKAIKSFAILTSIAVFSFPIIGSGRLLYIPASLSILLMASCLIIRILNNPVTIGSIETETTEVVVPSHQNTDILRALLYPFEVVLENLIIVPDSISKPYSLHLTSKIVISPIAACFLSVLYFNQALSIYDILFIFIGSLCTILLLLTASKVRRTRYAVNIYSFLICALLYYFVFDTSLETATNIGNLMNISKAQAAALLISPQLVVPSFCIYKHFIRTGFHKRVLYSAFFGAIFNLIITHLVSSVLLPDADLWNVFQSRDLRVTLMSILVLQTLIFANLILQRGKFQLRNCSLSLYVLLQDYLITSLAAMKR